MAKNLLIVESPAKAKTIEKYLGKDFIVKSSYGHIRDLDKGKKGITIENDFEPHYVVSPEKKKVVSQLKAEVKKVSEVWLATDEDREGEAISWHLCEELGLDIDTTKRIVFREITKSAIQKAIEKPRLVDKNLVDAQQARRILDRLVGFELSEVLWRKVKNKLSAGRVQSVAVKLIVVREREIMAFESVPYFKVTAEFEVLDKDGRKAILQAELTDRLDTEKEAQDFLEKCKGADFKIRNIEVKPAQRKPAPPFTTSTLQQEASRKMGFAVKRTMSTAQRLYEQGFISYMRTDSMALSATAIGAIADKIKSEYGEEYLKVRKYKSKSGAQEAHEAIRPTYMDKFNVSGDTDQQRLYELIWKRTIACQMENAKLEKTTVDIGISTVTDRRLKATGEVLVFDGFLKVYMESKDDDEEEDDTKGILPPLSVNQVLDLLHIKATERFTRPPARFTEAGLVKKLEELGIGRPSTYAPTITKIMEEARGYVVKEKRDGTPRDYKELMLNGTGKVEMKTLTEMTGAISNRLIPTDIGKIVTDFLDEHFDNIMEYGFTAGIEAQFDKIADGEREWKEMIKTFYSPFHEGVEKTIETAERAKGKRILGKDPDTGHEVFVTLTRFGPVVQIGTREEVGEEGKPKFANLRPGLSMETIEYEEAMDLFKLPRTVGQYEDKDVEIGAGRFGPYVKFDEKFVSLPKGTDPLEIELPFAIELIEKKRKEDAPIGEYEDLPISKGVGRFGPFLKWNGMFINVNKKYDFDNLSLDDAYILIKAKVEKEANRYIKQWPKEKIALENGRWGPFIRVKKKSVKIPKEKGEILDIEELKKWTLEDVKKIITAAAK
ncbi:MAG: DNA topoisomerase-1 [Saprospiraceae bacterium]|jgi:DNA topoisomerase-1